MRIVIGLTLGLGLILSVLGYGSHMSGRLLRSDPAVVAANASLTAFAQAPGNSLYEWHCAACHGARGRGDAARGIPDLTDADWLYGNGEVAELEQIITYGIRSRHPKAWNLAIMPGYARAVPSSRDPSMPPLNPQDIRDVVEFLAYAQGGAAQAAGAARGAAIFAGRGGCYDCHGNDAKGDGAIGAPNLTDAVALYGGDRESLVRTVAYGRQGVCPSFIGRITPAGIREVALHVYFFSHPRRSHGDH